MTIQDRTKRPTITYTDKANYHTRRDHADEIAKEYHESSRQRAAAIANLEKNTTKHLLLYDAILQFHVKWTVVMHCLQILNLMI